MSRRQVFVGAVHGEEVAAGLMMEGTMEMVLWAEQASDTKEATAEVMLETVAAADLVFFAS